MGALSTIVHTYKYNFLVANKLNVKLGMGSTINNVVYFEGTNKIGKFSKLRNVNIGFASYIGDNCFICDGVIGRYCSVGDRVKFIVGKHPVNQFISTHPIFYSTRSQSGTAWATNEQFDEYDFKFGKYGFKIGNDVWIGSDVKIIQDVEIGNGAIIAAGAVVTKNVEPYEVVGGVPARHIKYRFSETEIEFLEKIKWWELDLEKFPNIRELMLSPDAFFKSDVFSQVSEEY